MKRCKRCNSEINKKAKFCPKCGFKVPDNSWVAILLIVLGSIGLLIVGIFAVVFFFVKSTLNRYSDAEYVELEKYVVPNFFSVTGHNVCNFDIKQVGISEHREVIKQFRSCEKITSKDIEKYTDKLLEEDFFEETDEGETYYVKEVDDNFIIIVYFYGKDVVAYMYEEDVTDFYKTNRNVRI